jgi:hypothetical protein
MPRRSSLNSANLSANDAQKDNKASWEKGSCRSHRINTMYCGHWMEIDIRIRHAARISKGEALVQPEVIVNLQAKSTFP